MSTYFPQPMNALLTFQFFCHQAPSTNRQQCLSTPSTDMSAPRTTTCGSYPSPTKLIIAPIEVPIQYRPGIYREIVVVDSTRRSRCVTNILTPPQYLEDRSAAMDSCSVAQIFMTDTKRTEVALASAEYTYFTMLSCSSSESTRPSNKASPQIYIAGWRRDATPHR